MYIQVLIYDKLLSIHFLQGITIPLIIMSNPLVFPRVCFACELDYVVEPVEGKLRDELLKIYVKELW